MTQRSGVSARRQVELTSAEIITLAKDVESEASRRAWFDPMLDPGPDRLPRRSGDERVGR